jgi:hypothetical protein
MTDSSHEADLSIDAILAIGLDDHQSAVIMEIITAVLLKRIQTTLLPVLTSTRKTMKVLAGGSMAGAAASTSVQTFPVHTHMI